MELSSWLHVRSVNNKVQSLITKKTWTLKVHFKSREPHRFSAVQMILLYRSLQANDTGTLRNTRVILSARNHLQK